MQAYQTLQDMSVKISELITYPIKSCAGIKHKKIGINEMGLKGDRQLMIVQEDGLFMSQRKHPNMALIQPEVISSTRLKLSAPNMSDIELDYSNGSEVKQVKVWKDTFKAIEISSEVDDWLSEYLGTHLKLVKYDAVSRRLIDPDYAKGEQHVAFADGYPILVTHQSTLDAVNQTFSDTINMSRFRPNIVIESNQDAWQELNWKKLKHNDLVLELVKPCARCIMTGVDQNTGIQTGTEVFKTLKSKFPHNDKAVFGMNAIPSLGHDDDPYLALNMVLNVT